MIFKLIKIETILASYPRTRPPLTPRHEKLYIQEHIKNRQGSRVVDSLAQKLERWMHYQVAAHSSSHVLELGAGTLNHIEYEISSSKYDIVEPISEYYENSPQLSQVRGIYNSLSDVPRNNRYSRIISVAALEHMTNLPLEIALSAKLLEPSGIFQAGIPSEGGFLWWLGWRCTTGISYWLRNRLDYGILMRHEHVNKAKEIIAVVDYLFETIKIHRYPTPLHSMSFYTYLEARKPILKRVNKILGSAKL